MNYYTNRTNSVIRTIEFLFGTGLFGLGRKYGLFGLVTGLIQIIWDFILGVADFRAPNAIIFKYIPLEAWLSLLDNILEVLKILE